MSEDRLGIVGDLDTALSEAAGSIERLEAFDPPSYGLAAIAYVPWIKPHMRKLPAEALPKGAVLHLCIYAANRDAPARNGQHDGPGSLVLLQCRRQLPGRIIAGMKHAGSKNPVFLLDDLTSETDDLQLQSIAHGVISAMPALAPSQKLMPASG